MSTSVPLVPVLASLLLSLAPACSLDEDPGGGRGPAAADAAPEPEPEPDDGELFSCDAVDQELSFNCSLDESCAGFTAAEHSCISEVMAQDWARPPCEEYAACLGVPLSSCADTDAELSSNCGIADRPCSQMGWAERWCLSALMAMDWAQPPCDQYQACLAPAAAP